MIHAAGISERGGSRERAATDRLALSAERYPAAERCFPGSNYRRVLVVDRLAGVRDSARKKGSHPIDVGAHPAAIAYLFRLLVGYPGRIRQPIPPHFRTCRPSDGPSERCQVEAVSRNQALPRNIRHLSILVVPLSRFPIQYYAMPAFKSPSCWNLTQNRDL